jgi:mannose-6-phosphate isomerase
MTGVASLSGTVKHYDWGGNSFIPSLLQLKETSGKPFAEYWLGTHPQADCRVKNTDGKEISFRDIIHSQPAAFLGDDVYNRFHDFPYLLKALDVKEMLSIQVHPSKAAAERDFEEENEKGIPLDSPERNYKDRNHKPELMVAMSEFWLLHGFKSEEKTRQILQEKKELQSLLPVFEQGGYVDLYRRVMEISQEEVNIILRPLVDSIVPLYKSGKLDKSQEDFWAARAALSFFHPDKIDRGIFSVYLFNLVQLKKGEAIFQDAGVPHAYLEGQNIEIMASSDNVLRGGLTTKHIDVRELIKHVKCEATIVNVLKGEKRGDGLVYKTPAPDFELTAYELNKGDMISLEAETTEIFLLAEGQADLRTNDATVTIRPGYPSAVLFPLHPATLSAKETALIFKASVPVDK